MHVLQGHMRLIISCAMSAQQAWFLLEVATHVPNALLDRMHQSPEASHVNRVQQAPMQGRPAQNAGRVLQELFQAKRVEAAAHAMLAVLLNHPLHVNNVLGAPFPTQEARTVRAASLESSP